MNDKKISFIKKYRDLLVSASKDIMDLELVDNDTVLLTYIGGKEVLINIAGDSNLSIIYDVIRNIDL